MMFWPVLEEHHGRGRDFEDRRERPGDVVADGLDLVQYGLLRIAEAVDDALD